MYQQRGIASKPLWEEVKDACEYIDKLEEQNKDLRDTRAVLSEADSRLRRNLDTKDIELEQARSELAACREQLEEARQELSRKGEELTPKAKKSYLTIIAALCNKKQPLDITASSAVSVLKTEIEKIGLALGEDTTRKIVKEVRYIIDR